MNKVQDILFGETSQSIYFDCDSRPSSPTVEVFENTDGDDGTAETCTTGSASVDSVNTTFDATSGDGESDPRICYLAATTSIVAGRVYLLTNDNGEQEWGEVIEIDSGASVTLRHPLGNQYQSGGSSTFEGTRISISMLDSWVADKTNIGAVLDPNPRYRARWEFTNASSVTEVRYGYFDLVRASGYCSVTGLDVDDVCPGFLDCLSSRHREDQGANLIRAAWEEVKERLHGHSKADQAIRNQPVLDRLVVYMANLMARQSVFERGGGSIEAVDSAQKRFNMHWDGLIAEPKVPFAQTAGGAGSEVGRAPVWRR